MNLDKCKLISEMKWLTGPRWDVGGGRRGVGEGDLNSASYTH